jgi:hypothetical protein
MQAIDETARLITSLEFTHDQDPDIDRGPIDSALNEAVAVCLRDSAEAMRTGAVTNQQLDEQREVTGPIAEWCRRFRCGELYQVRPGRVVLTANIQPPVVAIYVTVRWIEVACVALAWRGARTS